jgi:hypothetical protein
MEKIYRKYLLEILRGQAVGHVGPDMSIILKWMCDIYSLQVWGQNSPIAQ